MAKIVIDANVIISAAFGGKPLEAAVRAMGSHKVYVSREIEKELIGVFSKLSKKLNEKHYAYVIEMIHELIKIATIAEPSKRVRLSRDAKDNHYLSLCREINADFLLAGDKDMLSISEYKLKKAGIRTRIVNPNQFLEET